MYQTVTGKRRTTRQQTDRRRRTKCQRFAKLKEVPLAKEFKTYRENNKLWTNSIKKINHQIADEEIGRVRVFDGVVSEPEVFYGK